MATVSGTLAAEDRLAWIADRLTADGAVTITAAAEALGVSEMTIRRDLEELEERGTARRVRGGARALGPEPFAERTQTNAKAKGRIAAKLAPLVPTRGAVAFDASSTVMRLAALLGDARDLTVLTNGLDTFGALNGLPGVEPLLTGGRLEPRTGSLVGPLAFRTASQMSVQAFFASAAAVSPDRGALESTLEEAEVKRAIAAGAERVIVAVDASKLGRQAVAVGLQWEQIDVLVTDLDPDDDRLAPYRELAELL
ncbi:MAG: DeoR/GlpR transcriptional regulator [Acidimicrobiales bacterium]|nr:DeoR/GlpR transcriptional regulator [Acidimicrobiales bacterium]